MLYAPLYAAPRCRALLPASARREVTRPVRSSRAVEDSGAFRCWRWAVGRGTWASGRADGSNSAPPAGLVLLRAEAPASGVGRRTIRPPRICGSCRRDVRRLRSGLQTPQRAAATARRDATARRGVTHVHRPRRVRHHRARSSVALWRTDGAFRTTGRIIDICIRRAVGTSVETTTSALGRDSTAGARPSDRCIFLRRRAALPAAGCHCQSEAEAACHLHLAGCRRLPAR